MEVEWPFPYEVTLARKPTRGPSRMHLLGFIGLELAELSTDEAPVALEMRTLDADPRTLTPDAEPAPHTRTSLLVYRHWNGRLLRPCAPLRMLKADELLLPGMLETPVRKQDIAGGFAHLVHDARALKRAATSAMRFWPITSIPERLYRAIPEGECMNDVSASSHDTRRAEYAEFLNGSAMIDGRLFVPSEGPVLRLQERFTGERGRRGGPAGTVQRRIFVTGLPEKGWLRGMNVPGKFMAFDDPRREKTIERMIGAMTVRSAQPHMDPVSGDPLVLVSVVKGSGSPGSRHGEPDPIRAARIRSVVDQSLRASAAMLGFMSHTEIRTYVALRASMRDGSDALGVATLGLSLADSAMEGDRTGKFTRVFQVLRSVCRETLEYADTIPPAPVGPRSR